MPRIFARSAIATASYSQADQVTAMTYDSFSDTRAYDPLMLQLTRITTKNTSQVSVMDMSYTYPSGQNNGRISQSADWVLGETVNYAYDCLNRLVSAQATNSSWGNSYGYDGFGNLTAKTVTAGSAPNFSASYYAATNQMVGGSYDANGNDISAGRLNDMENRLVEVTDSGQSYPVWGYDPWGKRVLEQPFNPNSPSEFLLVPFYSLTGQKLATYQEEVVREYSEYSGYRTAVSTNVYFGSRLIRAEDVTVATDRLGSVRANANGTQINYFPYGEERASTPDSTEKFGTYFKDPGGMYYADQRHYNYVQGRFLTPDPAGMAAADLANPLTWNRYSYGGGDPANSSDPSGLTDVVIGGITNAPGDGAIDAFATQIGAVEAFPYAGGGTLGGTLAVGGLTLQQEVQAYTVVNAIEAAAADSDAPINVFAFSGGATAFANALPLLPSGIVSRINNVVYASPGYVGTLPTVNGQAPTVIFGNGPIDSLVTATATAPPGSTVIQTSCVGHNADGEFSAAANLAGSPCNTCSAFSAPNLSVIDQLVASAKAAAWCAIWGCGSQWGATALLQLLLLAEPPVEQVTSTITYHETHGGTLAPVPRRKPLSGAAQ